MRFLFSMLTLCVMLAGSRLAAQAEVRIDESLKRDFSYTSAAPVLKPEAMTFLMLQESKPKENPESKTGFSKPQCFAANKQFVNCLR